MKIDPKLILSILNNAVNKMTKEILDSSQSLPQKEKLILTALVDKQANQLNDINNKYEGLIDKKQLQAGLSDFFKTGQEIQNKLLCEREKST